MWLAWKVTEIYCWISTVCESFKSLSALLWQVFEALGCYKKTHMGLSLLKFVDWLDLKLCVASLRCELLLKAYLVQTQTGNTRVD